METNLKSLLEYIEGDWSLQTNFYIHKEKKEHQVQQKINLFNTLSKLNTSLRNNNFHDQQYCLHKNKLLSVIVKKNNIHISEGEDSRKFFLSLKSLSTKSFQISCKSEEYEVYYDEKLYIINKNIMISTTLLKNVKNSRSIGLKVTSYVRSLQN